MRNLERMKMAEYIERGTAIAYMRQQLSFMQQAIRDMEAKE